MGSKVDWALFNWEHTTPEHHSYTANMKILRKMFMIMIIAGVGRVELMDYLAMEEDDLTKLANETK